MSSYRKRPIAVDARQFTTATMYDVVAWIRDQGGKALEASAADGPALVIQTLEGNMTARLDDWIVRGIKGEFHPVRADIFAETYEPVPDSEVGAEERVARGLAAHDYLMPDQEPDDGWWNGHRRDFREDYLAHARRVIALVRAAEQPAATRADAWRALADRADPSKPEISWFGDFGHQVGEWIRRQAEYEERRTATEADRGEEFNYPRDPAAEEILNNLPPEAQRRIRAQLAAEAQQDGAQPS